MPPRRPRRDPGHPPGPPPSPPPPPRPRGRPAHDDDRIVEAAREVLLRDPGASVQAVAAHAGVGIGALYRRYPGKEDLLRRVSHEGLRRLIAEAEAAEAEADGVAALTGFVERVVDADVHVLAVRIAAALAPTDEMRRDADRAAELVAALVARAAATGRLRADASPDDVDLVLDACASIRLPDPDRTRELRGRLLALLLDGLVVGIRGPR